MHPTVTQITDQTVTFPTSHGLWTHYDSNQGTPDGVTALLFDSRGFLWVGSRWGLYRYDGAEFEAMYVNEYVPEVTFKSIFEDRRGHIWFALGGVSYIDGYGVVTFDPSEADPEFRHFTTDDGLTHNHILKIDEDAEGRIWFATDKGISCYDGTDMFRFDGYDFSDQPVASICTDRDNRLWISVVRRKTICCYPFSDDGVSPELPEADGFFNSILTIKKDIEGRIWFSTYENRGFMCFDQETFTHYPKSTGVFNNAGIIFCDSRGWIWFGGWGNGLSCLDGRGFKRYTSRNGLIGNGIVDVAEDQEGCLWIGDSASGLSRFDPVVIDEISTEPVRNFLSYDAGAIWFNNFDTLWSIPFDLSDGTASEKNLIDHKNRTFRYHLRTLLKEANGGYLLGGIPHALLIFNSETEIWEKDDIPENVKTIKPPHLDISRLIHESGATEDKPYANVEVIIESRDDAIWIGTGSEYRGDQGFLCMYDQGRLQAVRTAHPIVYQIIEDELGRLWFGGRSGGGLSVYTPV